MGSQLLKYVSLGVLIVQTTSLVLMLRYSRTASSKMDASQYLSSTAVVMVEVCKVLACCAVIWCRKGGFSVSEFVSVIYLDVISRPWDTLKMLVPSVLYVIQNNLLYVALTNLDAATYQVTYQLKILTTALFTVVMLKKRLGIFQWISLVFLVVGISLVQIPSNNSTNTAWRFPSTPQVVGLLAVVAACFSSGFAGVYFEKILKGTLQSLWIRNVQLGIFGTGFGLLGVILNDLNAVRTKGFFQGYSQITWIVIALQAFGGILVAVVIKYADNILKSFAASLSIVLSVVFSYFILGDLATSRYFLVGTAIVVASTLLYTCQPHPLPATAYDTTKYTENEVGFVVDYVEGAHDIQCAQ